VGEGITTFSEFGVFSEIVKAHLAIRNDSRCLRASEPPAVSHEKEGGSLRMQAIRCRRNVQSDGMAPLLLLR
jgi:hypothetical protein